VEGGQVAHGELAILRRRASVAFQPVDAALHGVALLVDLGIDDPSVPRTSTGPATTPYLLKIKVRVFGGRCFVEAGIMGPHRPAG